MDEARRTNVLLEDLLSKFQFFGEGLTDVRQTVYRLEATNKQEHERLDSRLDQLETSNSKEHQLMMQMIKELNEEQANLKRAK